MLTEFGKVCRMIRLEVNQNLGDMAEALGVQSSFLSAIENGKKNVPKKMCEQIKELYSLSVEHYEDLVKAAEISKTQVKISMENMEQDDRNIVLSFARKFEGLDPKEKEKIRSILKGE